MQPASAGTVRRKCSKCNFGISAKLVGIDPHLICRSCCAYICTKERSCEECVNLPMKVRDEIFKVESLLQAKRDSDKRNSDRKKKALELGNSNGESLSNSGASLVKVKGDEGEPAGKGIGVCSGSPLAVSRASAVSGSVSSQEGLPAEVSEVNSDEVICKSVHKVRHCNNEPVSGSSRERSIHYDNRKSSHFSSKRSRSLLPCVMSVGGGSRVAGSILVFIMIILFLRGVQRVISIDRVGVRRVLPLLDVRGVERDF